MCKGSDFFLLYLGSVVVGRGEGVGRTREQDVGRGVRGRDEEIELGFRTVLS